MYARHRRPLTIEVEIHLGLVRSVSAAVDAIRWTSLAIGVEVEVWQLGAQVDVACAGVVELVEEVGVHEQRKVLFAARGVRGGSGVLRRGNSVEVGEVLRYVDAVASAVAGHEEKVVMVPPVAGIDDGCFRGFLFFEMPLAGGWVCLVVRLRRCEVCDE